MPAKKATRKTVRAKKATRKTVRTKKATRKTVRAKKATLRIVRSKKATRKVGRATKSLAVRGGGANRRAAPALFGLTQEARAGLLSLNGLRRSAAPALAVDPEEVERRHIYDVLRVKLRSLNEQARYLATVRPSLDSDEEEDEWLAADSANSQEQNLCRARLEELTAHTRFRNPGSGEELRLLDAIKAVGAVARQNGAFIKVVEAILAVVKAYKVSGTK